jgi:hypothetical protein
MRRRIEDLMRQEFGEISDHFSLHEVAFIEAKTASPDLVAQPGVYVFFIEDRVIKVGRHLANARKRSLEHVRDNTAGVMKAIAHQDGLAILYITLKPDSLERLHWVCALEFFLESNLDPQIRSKRRG